MPRKIEVEVETYTIVKENAFLGLNVIDFLGP